MSDTYPLKMTVPGVADGVEGASPPISTITVTEPGMVTDRQRHRRRASTMTSTRPTLGIKLEAINGVDAAAVDATVDADTDQRDRQISGRRRRRPRKKVNADFAAESAKVTVVGKDNDTNSDVNFAGAVANIAGKSNGNFLWPEAMADMAAALKAGFAIDFALTYGAIDLRPGRAPQTASPPRSAAGGQRRHVRSRWT